MRACGFPESYCRFARHIKKRCKGRVWLLSEPVGRDCKSKKEFLDLREKAFAMFDKLPKEVQEILIEENVFEPLSMVMVQRK